MIRRNIVHIDQEKCDGCGECVPACEEGAIQIIDGKAKIVSDSYCDGLGACLGHCPQDAISVITRQAVSFDAEAVMQHLATADPTEPEHTQSGITPSACQGTAIPSPFELTSISSPASRDQPVQGQETTSGEITADGETSGLANWPVQLHLVSAQASCLKEADLLIAADCVPFACADFHQRFLNGQPVVIGCPKLDDGRKYVQTLTEIVRTANLKSITVVRMEVPCCAGLQRIAQSAVELAKATVPVKTVVISRNGKVIQA